MFPQRMSSLAFRPDDSHPEPAQALEQHVLAGFTPDLALDLVLNLLVVRAAEATGASAAALALVRRDGQSDEMVCRAATGHVAPDLGIPLNPREGLSGVCLNTHQPQLSVDTELDPRVDPSISQRLGIRSILIVPVFETNDNEQNGNCPQFAGVLEVFSSSLAAFSDSDQKLLEGFAEECARILHAALKLGKPKPVSASSTVRILPALVPSDLTPSDFATRDFAAAGLLPARRHLYETWALVLGALTILATIAVGILIGSRIGWLSPAASHAQTAQVIAAETSPAVTTTADRRANPSSSENVSERVPRKVPQKASKKLSESPASPEGGDLVVYEKGKVIFRLKPPPARTDLAKHNEAKPGSDPVVVARSTTMIATTRSAASPSVWLAPDQAEELLQSRIEPEYPAQARAAHRAGNVVLEVQVTEDGSVANVRTLSGDPLLAAAATHAVRNWRYQPYRFNDQPSQFQTDVTLTFTLPN